MRPPGALSTLKGKKIGLNGWFKNSGHFRKVPNGRKNPAPLGKYGVSYSKYFNLRAVTLFGFYPYFNRSRLSLSTVIRIAGIRSKNKSDAAR